MTKRAPGKREIIRSPLRPMPLDPASPLGLALALCLGKIEVSLRKWPPEFDAAHAAIGMFSTECDEQKQKPDEDQLEMPLSQSGLSVRTTNFLEREGILTVGQLLLTRREDLLAMRRIGRATLEEIFLTLERLGFQLPPADEIGMASGTR